MAQELILIRGLPGSGKSTLAKMLRNLMDQTDWMDVPENHCHHFEADMFFVNEQGKYNFVPEKVSQAHGWCQQNAWDHLNAGHSVIVSNTFSRIWEMKPYVDMADKMDIKLTVITCEGNFGNVHNVDDATVEKMRNRWEKYTG